MSLAGFYRGKRVLVTGHTGFKGAWLAYWLRRMGAKVHGFALAPAEGPNLAVDLGLPRMLEGHAIGDLRDASAAAAALGDARPDLVFHLAAQSLVRESYRDPVRTFDTNVVGTANLLEALRGTKATRVCVVTTSDKCYLNLGTGRAFREEDPLGGDDPYSASKAAQEHVVHAYRAVFAAHGGPSLSTARAGNVLGGGDWGLERIIPDCARAVRQGSPVRLRNPYSIRPWQYVLDALHGYLLLAQRQWNDPTRAAGPWNFAPQPGAEPDVRHVVSMFLAELGRPAWKVEESEAKDAAHEAPTLRIDATKARRDLGWAPTQGVPQTLGHTARWYRGYLADPSAAQRLCDEAIEAFERAALPATQVVSKEAPPR